MLNEFTKEKAKDLNLIFEMILLIPKKPDWNGYNQFDLNHVFHDIPDFQNKDANYLNDLFELTRLQTIFLNFNGGRTTFGINSASDIRHYLDKGGFVYVYKSEKYKKWDVTCY